MTPVATNLVVSWIVFFIPIGLLIVQNYARPVYPTERYRDLSVAVTAFAMFLTHFNISLYTLNPWLVGSTLLGFAIAAPVAGYFESGRTIDGKDVYCKTDRFRGHLLTNLFGAMTAFFLWGIVHSVPSVANTFVKSLPSVNILFNVMLPLSAVAAFLFVRTQQVDEFRKNDNQHNIDEGKSSDKESDRENKIVGFSLKHWHQQLNFIHLVFATSVASASCLLLMAHGMQATGIGLPAVSWLVIAAIFATLGFLFVCGLKWSRDNRAVYLTFLTGTPAALGGAIIWLSCFKADAVRDGTMVAVAGIGYVAFCVEAIFADWARDNRRGCPPLHYFVPMAVAVVISVLLGIAYFAR